MITIAEVHNGSLVRFYVYEGKNIRQVFHTKQDAKNFVAARYSETKPNYVQGLLS